MAKYKIIPSSRTIVQSPISIGHKAEKGVEAIEFDLTAWVETYGSGTATIIMRRWGDAIPYPIALEIDENNKATWTLSDIDTEKAGMAYAQLNYIVGDEVVKKSDIYTFRVMDSLTGEGEPPEAYESWLEHLTHLAAEAMAEVLDIEGIVTDKTLTVNGGIADAKATGDALALKADKSTTYTKDEVDQLIEDVEVETDTTLEVSGAPADAAETGRQFGLIKADLGAQAEAVEALGGKVETIEPGLSNNAKVDLFECLRALAWKEGADGSALIENLTRALFYDKNDSRLVFKMDTPVTMNGKILDTGIKSPAPDEDFTIIVKVIINKDSGNGNYFVACAGTLNDDSASVFRLAVDFRNNVCEFVTNYLYADHYASYYVPHSTPSNTGHELIWVIRNSSQSLTKTLYVDGDRLLNKTESVVSYDRTQGVNIILGANAPTQGSQPKLDGVIEMARIYNSALSDAEIEQILVEFDNRIAFKIETPVNMVGKTINTGVNVPASNEDFTLIVKSTVNAFETGETNRYVALWGSLNNDTQAVLRLAVELRNNVCEFVTNYLYADHYASWYAPHSISPSVIHELMWIIRNDNGSLRKMLYVDGNRILNRVESTSDYQRVQGGQIVLGISNQGVPTLNGTIDLARIYNVALSDSEIERILNIDLS